MYETGIHTQTKEQGNRVCCLYRVSTEQQVDHNSKNEADIPMQRMECQKFAERMGWVIVHEEQEEGVSGHKIRAADRDKIQIIRDLAQQKKFDILLVFMFDRIGRIADETPFVVEWFVKNGVRVWSTQEGEQRFDSHIDFLTNYLRFWQADGESVKTSIRVSTRMGQIVEEGHYTGGSVPYGYKAVMLGRVNKKKQPLTDLAINEEEAPLVKMIFEKYVTEGYGAQRISNYLNERGLKNRSGNNWHPASIRGMLKNITYMGVLRSNQARSPVLPHLQIIDEETFLTAQRITYQRSQNYEETRTIPLNTRGQSLLAGNVFCGHCGGRLTLTTNGKYTTHKDGTTTVKTRIRYVCLNKTRKIKPCTGQTGYTLSKLDKLIDCIVHEIFDKMTSASKSEIVATLCGAQVQEKQVLAQKLRREYNKVQKDLLSLKQEVVKALAGQSSFTTELLAELIKDMEHQCTELETAYSEAQAEADSIIGMVHDLSSEYDQYVEWSKIYDTANIETKKMIVSNLIERVNVYSGYRLEIKFTISLEQFKCGLDTSA